MNSAAGLDCLTVERSCSAAPAEEELMISLNEPVVAISDVTAQDLFGDPTLPAAAALPEFGLDTSFTLDGLDLAPDLPSWSDVDGLDFSFGDEALPSFDADDLVDLGPDW